MIKEKEAINLRMRGHTEAVVGEYLVETESKKKVKGKVMSSF